MGEKQRPIYMSDERIAWGGGRPIRIGGTKDGYGDDGEVKLSIGRLNREMKHLAKRAKFG